ncbi:oxygen-binding di-iron domain-containing protein [Roseibium sp. LAB1]
MSDFEPPVMQGVQRVSAQWSALPSWLPVPGLGGLPVNSFLLKGRDPVLVDTGLGSLGASFVEALQQEVDLDDLRWIWLSHTDPDHIGNLESVLDIAPNAKVVTNFLGMGKMNLAGMDISRVHLLNPGESLQLSDRKLVPVRPPYYDAPETMGFFDDLERALFAADAFGAILPEPAATIDDVSHETLRDGLVAWSSIDAPWLTAVDRETFGKTLKSMERLDPNIILSGHLPLARKSADPLTGIVERAYCCGASETIDPLAIEHIEAAFA